MEKENTKEFVITRTFNAPRELVFKAFTEAKHLAHWWGPKGFKLNVIKLDVKPGGIFHYSMANEAGFEMYGIFKYLEIVAPEKIVFLNGFSDTRGAVAKSPFGFPWPLEVHNTWLFTEKNGVTTLTLTGKPFNATDEEQRSFFDNFASMNQGFGGTFDQLEEYLKTLN